MPPSIGIACHWNMKMEPAAVRAARDFWARTAPANRAHLVESMD
jgi:methylmalonyl-CoA mutase N-terminal domain/subunit